jgi:putative transposase
VNANAFVSLHNNRYQVDEVLIGHKVELVFDPFDLTDIEVRYRGRSHGKAIAFTLGRHVHPKARPEHPATQPEPSGIDYLKLIDAAHTQQLESRINYTALFGDTDGDTEPAEAAP